MHTAFLKEMREMLGAEYGAFEECLTRPHLRGIRVNTLKYRADRADTFGFPLRPCPFAPEGFYLEGADGGVGRSPWHHAGVFYAQEPSAMSAVTVLAPQPGDWVLDLCAAPGGKSSQIAAALQGKGLLWSNEIVRRRAQILLSNLERMGVRNAVISSARPDALAERLGGVFDKVLVDAPCSGEGMFRRDEAAVSEWSPEHSAACALRQAAILDSAAQCVKEGGVLVYSTCTFSFCENEDTVVDFLARHPEFSIEESGVSFGRAGFDRSDVFDLTRARRIFPMDGGEGHFVARLRRAGEQSLRVLPSALRRKPTDGEQRAAALFEECFRRAPYGDIVQTGEDCFLRPSAMTSLPDLRGLGVLRCGVPLGEVKRDRVEPFHALFMAARAEECRRLLDYSPYDAALASFLHGEELTLPASGGEERGFVAVSCGGVVTGFGKASGGRLKNRYPKGLRNV